MLVARKECEEFGHLIKDDILPNESYLEICLLGAAKQGYEFLDMWLKNCYLVDGQSLLESDFYKEYVAEYGDPYKLVIEKAA